MVSNFAGRGGRERKAKRRVQFVASNPFTVPLDHGGAKSLGQFPCDSTRVRKPSSCRDDHPVAVRHARPRILMVDRHHHLVHFIPQFAVHGPAPFKKGQSPPDMIANCSAFSLSDKSSLHNVAPWERAGVRAHAEPAWAQCHHIPLFPRLTPWAAFCRPDGLKMQAVQRVTSRIQRHELGVHRIPTSESNGNL